MLKFDEVYNKLLEKGSGKAISNRGIEYRIEARYGKILAFPKTYRVTIHEECWGTRAGGIYNGKYSIYDWYKDNI